MGVLFDLIFSYIYVDFTRKFIQTLGYVENSFDLTPNELNIRSKVTYDHFHEFRCVSDSDFDVN